MKILECSSIGDKRFSAFYAKVDVFGKFKSIEEHYQTCKCYLDEDGKLKQYGLKDGKGQHPVLLKIGEQYFHRKFLSQYFDLLWFKYLDKNPSFIKYLQTFDDFKDTFKGKKTINCQADSIRKYIKEGRQSILNDTKELRSLMTKSFMVVNGDVFTSDADIIGHQTNCLGYMGGGIATTVKKDYPHIYDEYNKYCLQYKDNPNHRDLLGQCQILKATKTLEIANLFGQFDINKKDERLVKTDYDALEKSLVRLRNKAMREGKSIALPYGIGCVAAGGDWNKVEEIITRVFAIYPIVLYKYDK